MVSHTFQNNKIKVFKDAADDKHATSFQ